MRKIDQFFARIIFALSAFTFTAPNFATAQMYDESKINDFSLEDLMNDTVTSASKIKQKTSEAPSIILVINRDQFEDYGWFNLNDALSHQAGFFLSKDYDRTTLGSRGLFEGWSNNHLLYLVDGLPFNDPMYGSANTWHNSSTFMIKSVEIIRGPGSALYGTNATNGVIAVNTMSGEDMRGRTEGRLRYGSMDTSMIDVYTGNVNGNFSYFAGFGAFYTDGNEYMSRDASEIRTGEFKVHDSRAEHSFIFKADGRGEMKNWSMQYHDQSYKFETGHGWLFMIPDFAESMQERKRLLSLSYSPRLSQKISSEFTIKYERKEIDWFVRYAPNNEDPYNSGPFPTGVSEYLNFFHDNIFTRAQGTLDLPNSSSLLAGTEANMFIYNGDRSHYSNTDLAGGTYGPIAGGAWQNAPSFLGVIKGKPVTNLGFYTQYHSGTLIPKIPITLGVRYDHQTVNYNGSATGQSGSPERTFSAVSPRLGVVWLADEKLSVKFLAARAFRAPNPSEYAGTNSWIIGGDIQNLEPEKVTTFELGFDWRLTNQLNWKLNAYHTRAEDQIGYNESKGDYSFNIYTTTTAGLESDVVYSFGRFKTFGNLSLAQRLGEEITDTTVSVHDDKVTWAPSLTANAGGTYSLSEKLKTSMVMQYMGEVKRRDNDRLNATNNAFRTDANVAAWVSFDASLHYSLGERSTASLFIKNLLDQERELIKIRDFPFDYKMEGRTFYGSLSYNF